MTSSDVGWHHNSRSGPGWERSPPGGGAGDRRGRRWPWRGGGGGGRGPRPGGGGPAGGGRAGRAPAVVVRADGVVFVAAVKRVYGREGPSVARGGGPAGLLSS